MDRVTTYRTIVKELLQCQAERLQRHPQPAIETELSFNEAHDNYLYSMSAGQNRDDY